MIRTLLKASALVCGLLGLAAGPAAAFQPGEVYWAPGACDTPPCSVHQVAPGLALPLAVIDPAPGQIAWKFDLSEAYASQYTPDTIVRITAAGSVSIFATQIDGPTGLLMTSSGTLLASSYRDGTVYDATGGGDLSGASVFASGFFTPRNLLELSTGEILLADQTRRVVFDISAGGNFSLEPAFAWGFTAGVYDLAKDAAERVYLSTGPGVYEITGGGDFAAETPHAWGRPFMGLAVNGAGRLLASEFETGAVFDITDGGDFSATPPVASVSGGFGDSALDSVPGEGDPPPPPTVPALGPLAYGVLAALLAATGSRSRRR